MKKSGIFPKVFAYTTLFLAAVIAITIVLFYQQFAEFYHAQQIRQLRMNYQRLYEELLETGHDREQMLEIAQRFADRNQTFDFRIMDESEAPLFRAQDIAERRERPGAAGFRRGRMIFALGGYTLVVDNPAAAMDAGGLLPRLAVAVAAVMVIALGGAAVFARMLETENTRRRKMEESQRYFFSAASHELKTPVAAARLVLEGMLAGVGDYGNHPKYLNECIKLMDEQSKTIYEILEIVNLDAHYAPIREEINIGETVADLLAAYKPMITAQAVSVDIPEDLSCFTDAKLLKKALSNVLVNAIRYTAGEIRIYSESGKLCVTNTGHIPEEHLPHLFDPFYRMDKARNRKNGQTGLGLTIVKKSLDILGADFGLENTADGVLFWMELPPLSNGQLKVTTTCS